MDMIGGSKFKSEKTEETEPEEKFDSSSAKKEASKALIKGVKNGDVQMVQDALDAFYEACSGE